MIFEIILSFIVFLIMLFIINDLEDMLFKRDDDENEID